MLEPNRSRPEADSHEAPGRKRRILVVDNYDSFTYNLVQYLGELGTTPIVWRNDQFALDDIAELDPDGIVVSPGPCTPNEAGLSVDVVRRYGKSIPTLGVCLGHQSVGQAYGATVRRADRIMHGKTSDVLHDATGVFQGLGTPVTVTRYHSLIITHLPGELLVNGWVDEAGTRVVMGIRHKQDPVWGVQFHPESILTQTGHEMLKNFLAICRSVTS